MERFGKTSGPEKKQPARMVIPARCQNSIEVTLMGQLAVTQASVSDPPFIDAEDDSGQVDGGDFDGLSLRTALDLRNLNLLDAEEVLRRQIIVARELGPTRTDGGPWTHEYEAACALEGIEPWPLGDRLVHEPPHTEKIK